MGVISGKTNAENENCLKLYSIINFVSHCSFESVFPIAACSMQLTYIGVY